MRNPEGDGVSYPRGVMARSPPMHCHECHDDIVGEPIWRPQPVCSFCIAEGMARRFRPPSGEQVARCTSRKANHFVKKLLVAVAVLDSVVHHRSPRSSARKASSAAFCSGVRAA